MARELSDSKLTPKGTATRDRILHSAIRIFARSGFAKGSFADISKGCKLSQAAVFHHFSDKNDLFKACLEKIVLQNLELVSAKMDARDGARTRVEKHFEGNLLWGIRYPEQAQLLLLVYYMACFDRDFEVIYSSLLAGARSRMESYLFAAEREKSLRSGVQIPAAAILLHDCLVGSFVNTLASKSSGGNEVQMVQILRKRWAMVWERIFK